MEKSLAVLIVEDSESDAQLIVRMLNKAGYTITFEQVISAAQMHTALEKKTWEIVISDFNLPELDGFGALKVFHETALDIPFIVVSGAMNEETAVDLMKAGAHDYVMKSNLSRLVPAIERELMQAEERRVRKQTEDKIKENARLLKIAGEKAKLGGWLVDLGNNLWIWSDETAAIHEMPAGYSPFVEEGISYYAPEWREKLTKVFTECAQNGIPFDEEMEIITAKGKRVWVRTIGEPVKDEAGKITKVQGAFQDITERKQAEEALFASQALYRLLAENSSDVITMINADGNAVYISPSYTQRLGYEKDELLNIDTPTILQQIHPDDRQRIGSEIKRGRELKLPTGLYEYRMKTKQGDYVWVEDILRREFDENGNFVRTIVNSREISERKQAEIRLREEEERIRTILDLVGDPIFVKDNDHRITLANLAFYNIFCMDEKSVIGQTLVETVPEDERQHFLDVERRVLDTGITDCREEELTVKGLTRTIITRKIRFIDESGNKFLVGSIHDITARKQVENELIKAKEKAEGQEKFVKGILDNLQDAFFQADLNGCITYVNPTAQKMYGYSYDELIGKKTEMLYAEPRAREKLLAALRQFEKLTDWNSLGLRKDGSSFWVSMNVQFIKDNSGKIIGTEGVLRDITERKQAEIALRESEVKFHQMFDISPVGIVLVGLDKRFIRCNHAFSQSLGYGIEELVGKLITDVTFSEDIHIGMTEMMAILKGEIAQSKVQKRYLRKEGQIIWGEATISLLRDSEGCAQYFLAIIQDITERKKVEEALIENEQKYRTLFETADDAILLFTGDQWVDCNAAALWVFGCTREQIIGAHPHRFSPPTQPDGRFSEELFVERIKLTFSKKPQSFEWVHCRADGTLFNAEVHLNRVDLEDKPFIQAIVRDVSERKQAEQDRLQAEDKVRESEELFRTAFESSVAGISMVGPDGNFIRVNNKFCEIVGYKKEELFCLKFNDITYEKDMKVGNQYLKQLVTGELESTTVEKRYIKKNGNVIWVLLSIAAIRNKQKELQFFVTYTKDITEQKEAIEKLKLMVENTIRTIALIVEARDPYTSGHQIRVAEISVVIAKELNLPDEQIQGIYYACLIHDLGKIQVPAEILSNPRKLTNLEFELIKTHPIVGYELIKDIDFPWPIAEMVYQHHERLDGSGYPRHLKGNRISIEAKIIGVADVIEAMSSHRPYRPALGLEAALDEINKNKGVLYDTEVVEAFNKVKKNDKTLFPSA